MPGEGSSYGFVVRHMEVDFYAVSVLGDILTVQSKIQRIQNSSIELLQEIYKDDTKLFSMKLILVYVESCVSKRIPDHFRDIFMKLFQEHLSS